MSSQGHPGRSSLSASLALVWRSLRSMRTALMLLLLVATASVVGSLLPQWPNTPDRVVAYLRDHPFWGALFDRAGFLDVFGSWWFVLLTTLLVVSLVACLVPRTRGLVRAARTPPLQAREIDAFPLYEIRHVASQPSFAISAARRVLRRRLFRVARDGERLAADKGLAREAGSLMFHWAFLILLIGVIIGKGTGFSGRVTVVEGEIPWTDAQANYDSLRAGRFFDGDFTGIGVRLVDFRSDFFRTGVPMDFVSDVEILDPDGNLMRNQAIRVNEPAEVEGLRIYQFGFGWAPVVAVSVDGKAVAGGPIVFVQERAPKGVPQLAVPWRGFLKLPSIEPQAAIEFELWPDSRALVRMLETGEPTPMLTAFDPLMRYMVWRGELTDPSLRSLDTTFMRRAERGVIGGERSASISLGPGGNDDRIRVTFSELRQYSVFQVARDSGVPLVLLAAILVLVGLLPALYTSRRKVWVRAERAADHTVLAVGGFALQRRSQFEEEFARLVRELVAACGGDTSPTSDRSREQVSSP